MGTTHPTDGFLSGLTGPEPVELDSNRPYVLGLAQPRIDEVLAEYAGDLGLEIRRGVEVVGTEPDEDGVELTCAGGIRLRARWVVGCDGGRSTVRHLAGIDFPGEPARHHWLLGEVELGVAQETIMSTVRRVHETHRGFGAVPLEGGLYRVVTPAGDTPGERGAPTTLEDLRRQLIAHAGTDFGLRSARWLSRFGDATRLAERFRVGRVLLAGDAAHVHPPLGGQGLNLGLQDAVNLGWKLAATVAGWAPDGLLDTYESERRPVAHDVLELTRALVELQQLEPGPRAVRSLLADLVRQPGVHRHLIEKVIGLDIRYAVGESHGPLGRRMRDIPLSDGRRLYRAMRRGTGILITSGGADEFSLQGWADRVQVVSAGPDQLPAEAVLVRPDGHIVWLGEGQASPDAALERWFGNPRPDAASAHSASGAGSGRCGSDRCPEGS